MTQTPVRHPGQRHPWPSLTVSEHGATLDHDRLIMPRAEARMLWALARANNQVVTWIELHHLLWPTEIFINPDPLYAHLSRLRTKLRIGLGLRQPDLLDDKHIPIRTIVHAGPELRWPPDRLHLHYPRPAPVAHT